MSSRGLSGAAALHLEGSCPENVTVVSTVQSAERAVEVLKSAAASGKVFGCDTEVSLRVAAS